MKKYLVVLLLLLASATTYAGKKPLIEDPALIKASAIAALDSAMMAPEGLLYRFGQKEQITGLFQFDITIHEKGKVITVFVKNNEGGSIPSQNKLKDFVHGMQFDFKMPKGKDYKFSYQFNFTH